MSRPAHDTVSHALRYLSGGVAAIALAACCGGGGGSMGSGSTGSGSGAVVPVLTATASPAAVATAAPTTAGGGNAGGGVTIAIPAPQPVICSPSTVSLGVAQRVVVSCTSDGFTGSIAATVADPSIATVQVATGTYTLFYVNGIALGTTTATFLTTSGGTGQLSISVVP